MIFVADAWLVSGCDLPTRERTDDCGSCHRARPAARPLMTAIVVDAVATGDAVLLNVLAVIAIVGFTATVAVARFMVRPQ